MLNIDEYLNNFFKGTKNPSLKAMEFFMKKFNNFEQQMNFIHIAGTNGKGSCTEMMANILEKQGYKVGKFLSPHLVKYNERISINGVEISDEEMANIIEELQPIIEEYNKTEEVDVTLFELETTMALLYFYRNNVDFVVLETGLGGLYDCTNIISKPLVSIITSIGYDHLNILGKTLPEIAIQKAGIIKEGSQTVIFEQEKDVNDVFIRTCSSKNNKLHIISNNDISNYRFDENFQYFNYKDMKDIKINLKGRAQIKNASICIEAIKIIRNYGYKITDTSILEGLSTVIHKGRLEKLNSNPEIIFDGAHNEPAIINLLDTINMYYSNRKRVYIVSILNRKDYKKMLELLSKDREAIFIMTSGNDAERYTTKEELYNCMSGNIEKNRIYKYELDEAIANIMRKKDDTVYFVIGSFYVYGDVVNLIKKNKDGN